MPLHGQSIVWKYFKKHKDSPHPECRLCLQKVKCSGNTTNLKNHLKRKHDKVSLPSSRETKNIRDRDNGEDDDIGSDIDMELAHTNNELENLSERETVST